MVDRLDHSQRMRQEAPEVTDESLPRVSTELVEHLEKCGFGDINITTQGYPGTVDHMVAVSHAVTFAAGQRDLLAYLRELSKKGH